MAVVYLGVGSNLGEREQNIQKAISLLKENEDIQVAAVSALIESEAQGGPPQGNFLNGALRIETDLLPLELLSHLKNIERRLGRPKNAGLNQPRPIDLDILFYDDVVIVNGKNLTVPHPRLHERPFVLKPLLELAPDLVHPKINKTVRQLADEFGA
jgi:2-amino-4-hydroxy-6-hydroxymethyldihydropteridine diphosphokinase